jgi:hypothetical protein
MKSKLYKTHRKASYYRLRRLGYFSMSLMVATIIVVVPLTLAQASTTSSVTISSTSIESSSLSSSASDSSSAVSSEAPAAIEVTFVGQDLTLKLMLVYNP